ncbi:MAG TPA: hypothetical protein DF712_14890, partial [Balneola sp.]|nr:hypothetical protein [Balneola sp.]
MYGPNGEDLYFSRTLNTIFEENEFEDLFQQFVISQYGQEKWNNEASNWENSKEGYNMRLDYIERYGITTSEEMLKSFVRIQYGNEMGGYESGLMKGFKKIGDPSELARELEINFDNVETYYRDPTMLQGGSDFVAMYAPLINYGFLYESTLGQYNDGYFNLQAGNILFRRRQGGHGKATVMTEDQYN